MNGTELLQFLQSIEAPRADLRSALNEASGRVFVYYICPLSNLRRIAKEGIRPHTTAPSDRTDLSGQSVQARRDVDILLTRGRRSTLHRCVNFFLNPLNWTFRAFQRHGLLREASTGSKDDGVVCILEVDLSQILESANCDWTLAPRNFAGSQFANFTPDYYRGLQQWPDGTVIFDWNGIYSVHGSQVDRALNSKRSAEFIAFREQNTFDTDSAPIPFSCVNRIIVPDDTVRILTADQAEFLKNTGKPYSRLGILADAVGYFPRDELLMAERGFIKSMEFLANRDPNITARVNAAMQAIIEFEQQHPELTPKDETFLRPASAYGEHGVLHCVRVMFWAAFLAQYIDDAERGQIMPLVLAAAAIHDTCRETDQEDEIHGQRAAETHAGKIQAVSQSPVLVDSCLNAVRTHCLPDAKCEKHDVIWKLLKDADALERGRFGQPNGQGGCDSSQLRMDALRQEARYPNVSWMARYAAYMTQYTPIGQTPCADFCNALCEGVKAYQKGI
jgi:HD superfamily phosphohydrolase YqeK